MPIFTNRVIAKMLEELEPLLPENKKRDLLGALGSAVDGDGRIGAEWELAVYHSLRKVGELELPTDVPGKRAPDAILTCHSTRERVQVEVTAISDSGLHERNPVSAFWDRLRKFESRLGKSAAGTFDTRIGHQKVQGEIFLGVPERKDMDAFFSSNVFKNFEERIRANPRQSHELHFECRGIESAITFSPGRRYSSGGYIAHELMLDLRDNHITKRLKKKASQIKAAGFGLPSIVVLCDGDCRAIKTEMHAAGMARLVDILGVFLNGRPHWESHGWTLQKGIPPSSKSVNGVIVVAVKDRHEVFGGVNREIVVKGAAGGDDRRYPLSIQAMEEIAYALQFVPKPRTSPNNARRQFGYPNNYGASEYTSGATGMKIKISLLTLQGLLSGSISHSEFARDHGDLGKRVIHEIKAGRMISKLEVEHCPDDDDDWAVIEFGAPDPRKLFSAKRD